MRIVEILRRRCNAALAEFTWLQAMSKWQLGSRKYEAFHVLFRRTPPCGRTSTAKFYIYSFYCCANSPCSFRFCSAGLGHSRDGQGRPSDVSAKWHQLSCIPRAAAAEHRTAMHGPQLSLASGTDSADAAGKLIRPLAANSECTTLRSPFKGQIVDPYA